MYLQVKKNTYKMGGRRGRPCCLEQWQSCSAGWTQERAGGGHHCPCFTQKQARRISTENQQITFWHVPPTPPPAPNPQKHKHGITRKDTGTLN